MAEIATEKGGATMRDVFVTLLLHCEVNDPQALFDKHRKKMMEDIKRNLRMSNPRLRLNEVVLKEQATAALIADIKERLLEQNHEIENFFDKRTCSLAALCTENRLIREETSYSRKQMEDEILAMSMLGDPTRKQIEDFNAVTRAYAENGSSSVDVVQKYNKTIEWHAKNGLNVGQKKLFKKIMRSVRNGKLSNTFFAYGPGGSGKTTTYKMLIYTSRLQSKIVLAVASSGIAAILLPGGRTGHSRFKIPIDIKKNSTCNIFKGKNNLCELLKRTDLIVWDEAPMTHRYTFEALDRTLRDIRDSKKPFGGITCLLGGDFRQVLPIVKYGSKSQIIEASIFRSELWSKFEVCELKKNMRVLGKENARDLARQEEFAKWLLHVGDGTVEADSRGRIDLESVGANLCQDLDELIETTFPDLQQNMNNVEYFKSRAILTPLNKTVTEVNREIVERLPGKHKKFRSIDRATDTDCANQYPVEWLNTIEESGVPPHKLRLKVGMPIMLMRNLVPSKGHCNGSRYIVQQFNDEKEFSRRLIKVKPLHPIPGLENEAYYIPRIRLKPKTSYGFQLERTQFPIRPAFCMTINKAQGQTLKAHAGVYLPNPVFGHGQLYVACSRVTKPENLSFCITPTKYDT